MTVLSAAPYFSDADAAESDLLAHEFAKVGLLHRERCPACSAGGPWCADLRDAWAAVEEWRRGRILRSKAAWLRAGHELDVFRRQLGLAAVDASRREAA